ncbi:MAG TPA: hypothetical protein VJN96_02705 [Vicinamibacterales bacterium]|nr:hypothetical protein [Vicinamibacterales bacterium]
MPDAYLAALISSPTDGPCDLPDVFQVFILTANLSTHSDAAWKEFDALRRGLDNKTSLPSNFESVSNGLRQELLKWPGMPTSANQSPECQDTRGSFMQGPDPGLALATRCQKTAADNIREAASMMVDKGAPDQVQARLTAAAKCLLRAAQASNQPKCHAPNRGLWTDAYVPALHAAVTIAIRESR